MLLLPDGRVVLQRRTKDAPRAPGKLGMFGGELESGEHHRMCVEREVSEETSLPVSELTFDYVGHIVVPAEESETGLAFSTHLYTAQILSLDFEVFEGDCAEARTLEELKDRTDLTSICRRALSKKFGGTYGA